MKSITELKEREGSHGSHQMSRSRPRQGCRCSHGRRVTDRCLGSSPQQLFAYLAFAGHRERPRWRHPVLLRHNEQFLSGRLVACIGPAMDGPLPALLFGDIQPVLYPITAPFAAHAPSTSVTPLRRPNASTRAMPCTFGGMVTRSVIAGILGCDVHLTTPGMMERSPKHAQEIRRIGSPIACALCGHRGDRREVRHARAGHCLPKWGQSGAAVFRGTRVPPGPIFSMLAETSAEEIVRSRLSIGVECRYRTRVAAGVPLAGARSTMGRLIMRSFALIEGDQATMLPAMFRTLCM